MAQNIAGISRFVRNECTTRPVSQWWGSARDDSATPARNQASACRRHVLGDAIDAQDSLELRLEIGPGVPPALDRDRRVAFLHR